jgi:hypothetical protein
MIAFLARPTMGGVFRGVLFETKTHWMRGSFNEGAPEKQACAVAGHGILRQGEEI